MGSGSALDLVHHAADVGGTGLPVVGSYGVLGHQAGGQAHADAAGVKEFPDVGGAHAADGHVVGAVKGALQVLDVVAGHAAGTSFMVL